MRRWIGFTLALAAGLTLGARGLWGDDTPPLPTDPEQRVEAAALLADAAKINKDSTTQEAANKTLEEAGDGAAAHLGASGAGADAARSLVRESLTAYYREKAGANSAVQVSQCANEQLLRLHWVEVQQNARLIELLTQIAKQKP